MSTKFTSTAQILVLFILLVIITLPFIIPKPYYPAMNAAPVYTHPVNPNLPLTPYRFY